MNKNPIGRKALSLLLSFALILSVFGVDTAGAFAAQSSIPTVLYLDSGDIVITETGYSVNNGTEVPYVGSYLITQNGNGTIQHSITVHSGTQNITLCNVHARPNHNSAFEVESGLEADITLVGSNSLDTSGSSSLRAGLAVNAGNTVHISGSGSLTATGGVSSAGIGGNNYQSCGIVEISGGTVTANGNTGSAGIGGGANGTGGDITISGGTVIANGNDRGAGIGGGAGDAGGSVTVSGGTITANGGIYGAGIGGGGGGAGGSVTVSGGTITANGGIYGAGIGGGSRGAGGDVTICGSNTEVTAKGQNGGYDIGSATGSTDGGTLTVGDSNTAEPLPVLKLLSAGTNAANANNNRPQFMNCVIQGAGAKDASGKDISGCYDKNGKLWLDITMQTPFAVKVGESVALSASVKRHYFNDTVTLPETVQFTGSGKLLGSSTVTLGAAQINWTPMNGNEVWLKAAYDPATNDRYGSAESIPFDYTPGKTIPVVSEKPTASAVTAGSPLSASNLSGGKAVVNGAAISGRFQWVDPTAIVTGSGDYQALFAPEDTADYNNTSYIMVPVTVTPTPAPTPTPQNNSGNSSHDTTTPSLPVSITDTPTNTTIDLSGAIFPAGVTSVSFSVTKPAQGDKQAAAFRTVLLTDPKTGVINIPEICSLSLLDQNGNPVTFTGSVTVRLPLPSGIRGTPHILRYESGTKTFTDMNAKVENGFLVFSTTHFSDYVIAGVGNAITLDTLNYQMPVNGSYQIGIQLAGTKAASVKFHSTNDKIATVVKMKNGNYQVNGKGTGTAYVMFDVYDGKNKFLSHVSVRIDVKDGVHPRGDSTRQVGLF